MVFLPLSLEQGWTSKQAILFHLGFGICHKVDAFLHAGSIGVLGLGSDQAHLGWRNDLPHFLHFHSVHHPECGAGSSAVLPAHAVSANSFCASLPSSGVHDERWHLLLDFLSPHKSHGDFGGTGPESQARALQAALVESWRHKHSAPLWFPCPETRKKQK